MACCGNKAAAIFRSTLSGEQVKPATLSNAVRVDTPRAPLLARIIRKGVPKETDKK